jgi:phospholipid/cholesterol/gamma-HCH transport system permease protein
MNQAGTDRRGGQVLQMIGRDARLRLGDILTSLGYAYVLHRTTLSLLLRGRITQPVLRAQIFFTGTEALPILALISLGIGAAVIIQGVALLPKFGQGELTYRILILVITRELGPLLTALIIAARSGSAITTEIGNMVVDHEIEAYVAAGISPLEHIAVPRVLGVAIAMVFLNLYFNLFGLLGSCLFASMIHGLPLAGYVGNLVLVISAGDVLSSLLKSLTFGIILATVATYHGFKVKSAVTEVPQKTIASLGTSMTLCIVANTIITVLFRVV